MRDKKEEYKYSIIRTGNFKKHLKNLKKQKKDLKLLESIISILAKGEKLPPKNKDHKLVNNYVGARECHITPDWLLIYLDEPEICVVTAIRTGSHSDLFQ